MSTFRFRERDCVMPLRKHTAQLTVLRFCYRQDGAVRAFLIVTGIGLKESADCDFFS